MVNCHVLGEHGLEHSGERATTCPSRRRPRRHAGVRFEEASVAPQRLRPTKARCVLVYLATTRYCLGEALTNQAFLKMMTHNPVTTIPVHKA